MKRLAPGFVLALLGFQVQAAFGQGDTVRLKGVYDASDRPALVVLPVAKGLDSIRAIIQRDLDYSDRVEIVALPSADAGTARPAPGPKVNYALYRVLHASLAVEITGNAGNVAIRLHDLGTEKVREEMVGRFDLSGVGDSRMLVHRASDDIVKWITQRPGIAATRFLFLANGDKRIYRVDSDGYGLAAVSPANTSVMSPVWSPDGSRFAYTQSYGSEVGSIFVYSFLTGGRVLVPGTGAGQNITPAFSPDGKQLIYTRLGSPASEFYASNVADMCCPQRLTVGRFAQNFSPVYSPDGRRIAFVSDRTGRNLIYSMAADGTDQSILVPPDGKPGHCYAPDWSPDGLSIVFHRDVDGTPQIFMYDIPRRRLKQLTSSGQNEDASFAPDGQHIVFVSHRTGRGQLFILDTETFRIRQIMTSAQARLPAWSPRLGRTS